MKTRFLASIITGILATSVAHAEMAFSTNNLDVIYSGLEPSFTRNVDKTSHYTASAQLQQAAEHKSTCDWRAVDNNINTPRPAYTVVGNSDYFALTNLQNVCVSAEHKSMCDWRAVNNNINVTKVVYPVVGNSDYLAPPNLQYVCGLA